MSEPSTLLPTFLPLDKESKPQTPRKYPYEKLLARFDEPLFLLACLSQTRGPQTPRPIDANRRQGQRREFLRNLAQICDGKRGGSTFTAIAVQDTETCYRYCIASPSPVACSEALTVALGHLSAFVSAPVGEKKPFEAAFIQESITRARHRIKDYVRELKTAVDECLRLLGRRNRESDQNLIAMLQLILRDVCDSDQHFYTCFNACSIWRTNPDLIDRLSSEAQLLTNQGLSRFQGNYFEFARHYLGRLASRLELPVQILRDTPDVAYLLDSYEIDIVPILDHAPAPNPDNHTNLDGIVGRMYGNDNDTLMMVKRSLIRLNDQSGKTRFTNYMNQYRRWKPSVHAEICILEHFYNGNLDFVEGDKYVCCSKPACFCCRLYFKYHPSRPMIPESHQKIYVNWRPPLISNFRKDDVFSNRQRDLMQKMIEAVREDVADEAAGRTVSPRWHADSTTGMSSSVSLGAALVDIIQSPEVQMANYAVPDPLSSGDDFNRWPETGAAYIPMAGNTDGNTNPSTETPRQTPSLTHLLEMHTAGFPSAVAGESSISMAESSVDGGVVIS